MPHLVNDDGEIMGERPIEAIDVDSGEAEEVMTGREANEAMLETIGKIGKFYLMPVIVVPFDHSVALEKDIKGQKSQNEKNEIREAGSEKRKKPLFVKLHDEVILERLGKLV